MVNKEVIGTRGHSNLSSAAHRLTYDASQDAEVGESASFRADAVTRNNSASSIFQNHRNVPKFLGHAAQKRGHSPSAQALMGASALLLLVSCLSWQFSSFPSGATTHILGDHAPYR